MGGMETGSGGIWWVDPRKSNNGFGRKLRCRCLKTNMEFTETGGRSGISYRTCCNVFISVVMMDTGLASAIEMVRLNMFQHRSHQNSWGYKLPRNRTGTE